MLLEGAAWGEGASQGAGGGPCFQEFRVRREHGCFLGASWCVCTARHCPLSSHLTQQTETLFPHFTDGDTEAEGAVTSSGLCSGFGTRGPRLTGEASGQPLALDPALSKRLQHPTPHSVGDQLGRGEARQGQTPERRAKQQNGKTGC